MLKILILIYIIDIIITNNDRKSFKELIDIYLNELGYKNAYLSYEQYISVLKSLKNDFPNYLELSSIGKTYEGNEMPLIIMKSPYTSNEESIFNSTELNNTSINYTYLYQNDKDAGINSNNTNNVNNTSNNSTNETIMNNPLYDKSGIFFNGMHHGKEPVSMMMNIYLILHLLSLPKEYLHLFLSSTNIYFLPVVNIDAFKYNTLNYKDNQFSSVRKNRRVHKNATCSIDRIGVDLNRNYDLAFGYDNDGSTGKPCRDDYRGEYPFSEPETNNIKNFVDSHPNIKISFNYHTYGNLIITPFNYLKHNASLKIIKEEYPLHYKMYEDFRKEAKFPVNFLFGNAENTIKYKSNGEATDWFLGKKKILSFSPELGNGNSKSDVFFPNRNLTFDIMDKNLPSAIYAIQKSMFYLKSELLSAECSPCMNKNRYNDIYFNNRRYFFDNYNLKDIELRNCFSNEVILNVKIKMTNHGYGTYYPGIEFNYNQQNSNASEAEKNRKYFYFLALDLKVDLNDIKSICYWSTSEKYKENITIYNFNYNSNFSFKNYDLKERCTTNKENEINDMKLFIDNEIKPFESIIVNIQIIVKRDSFLEKKHLKQRLNHRSLENSVINGSTNNTYIHNSSINETEDLIWLYTKKKRIIKSEDINGNIMEWKFNDPNIVIKINDFKESKGVQLRIVNQNPYRLLSIMICSTFIIMFFLLRIVKTLNVRNFQELAANGRREINGNNNSMSLEMQNEQAVNNFENASQLEIRNNEHQNNAYQISRDESESYSNSDSP